MKAYLFCIMEIWKSIKGYEGIYEVSNLGSVKSLRYGKEKILKFGKGINQYSTVQLWSNGIGKTRKVHQLVAESFLNHISSNYALVVNHINFNKLDNRLDNLEIITQRENTNRKHCKSSSIYTGVYKQRNKWRATIVISGKRVNLGCFINEYDAHLAYENKLRTLI